MLFMVYSYIVVEMYKIYTNFNLKLIEPISRLLTEKVHNNEFHPRK